MWKYLLPLAALCVGLYNCDSSIVESITQEQNVLVLKSENFEDALKLKFLLVEFCNYYHFYK